MRLTGLLLFLFHRYVLSFEVFFSFRSIGMLNTIILINAAAFLASNFENEKKKHETLGRRIVFEYALENYLSLLVCSLSFIVIINVFK